ncbi:PAS domain S-box protein [Dethiosulfatarculus sandiegensis]|uniref:histidine kinase n=1 Tax=Dethiosulfatarculus sandiegensis TaxID=1429043 RepID=A0A0D2GIN4_9BACT|nr:PAS domain S-box protein [Dethiosulfatarculus sandiegensis]KIX14677.1 hypothetical protein X474_08505 [Dethiosulfatarculus sandiegensis]
MPCLRVAELLGADPKTILDHALKRPTMMVENEYGFYGFYLGRGNRQGVHLWSGEAMRANKPAHLPIDQTGAMHRQKSLMVDDDADIYTKKVEDPFGYLKSSNLLTDPRLLTGKYVAEAAAAIWMTSFTKLKGTVDKPTKSQSYYRTIFETNHIPELIIDPSDGLIVDANQTACRFYGYSLSEIRTKKIHDINTLSPEAVIDEMKRAKQRDCLVFQFRHRLNSGEVRDVEVHSGPVRLQGRTLLHSVIIDITGRKLAEKDIKFKNENLKAIFASAPYVLILIDADARVVNVNHAGENMLGRSKEDLLGLLGGQALNCINSFGREGCGNKAECAQCPIRTRVEHTLSTGQSVTNEESSLKVMAGERAVNLDLLISTCLINRPGAKMVLISILDITDQKRVAKELKASEERYRLMAENTSDSIWIMDAEFNLTYLSPSTEKMFGYTSEEWDAMEWGKFVHPDAKGIISSFSEEMRRNLHEGGVQSMIPVFHKNGRKMWIEFIASPVIGQEGQLTGVVGVTRDITERKKAEDELRRSQGFTNSILETSPTFIYIYDLQKNTLIYCNPRMLEALGYSSEELKQRGEFFSTKMLHPDDMPIVAKYHQRLAESPDGRMLELEYRIRHARGRWILLRSREVVFLRDEQGRCKQIMGSAEDVSEKKRAEEDLRNSESRYRSLAENSPDYITRYDRVGRHLYVNQASCQVTGISAEDFEGRTHRELGFPPELCEFWENSIKEVFATGKPLQATSEWESTIGHLVLDWRVCPEFDQDGRVASVLGISRDITALVQAEKEMRATAEYHKRILETALDGFWRTDTSGNILEVNQAYCRMSGYESDEILSMKVHQLDTNKTADDIAKLTFTAMKHGGACFESRHRRKDGSLFDVEISVQFKEDEGGNEFVFFLRDVSDRRRLEDQLRQAQKMEAVGTLAGGIAHDFNNMLAAVSGFAEIIHEDAQNGKVAPNDVEQILAAAHRAKELIQQILLFSSKKKLELKPIDLNKVVKNTQVILQRTLPKMIEIDCELSEVLPVVLGDPVRIEQALLNLASNAKDAMPDGGRLTLSTCATEVKKGNKNQHPEMLPGHYALLKIADTGHGIKKEHLAHIFDPFFTTKEIGKGTGLGLASAYGIAKSHKGYIYCQSEVGRGTIFELYLNIIERKSFEAYSNENRTVNTDLHGTETILLVDDEEPLRQISARILTSRGYKVFTANSGEEALALYRSEGPAIDLVIMDLGMPGMGGAKAAMALMDINSQLKLLIASGYPADTQLIKNLEAGEVAYVTKPFKFDDLLTSVRNILDKK